MLWAGPAQSAYFLKNVLVKSFVRLPKKRNGFCPNVFNLLSVKFYMARKHNSSSSINSFFSDMVRYLPGFATFEKVADEFVEHKDFAWWVFFRVVIPVLLLNALVNLFIFDRFRLSPTIFGVVVFFYATFLVDLDSFFNVKKNSREATSVQEILILLFAPVVIYYMLSKKLKPIRIPYKYFHRKQSMVIFCFFSFILGWMIFFHLPDAFFFMLFAFLGYVSHLIVDKVIVLK